MKLRNLGVIFISVTSIALGLFAPAATTPPNPGYAHRVDFNGKTFWTDDEGATSTGAEPIDADRGFIPSPHGPSYGPDRQTDPVCAQPPAQSVRDHATFSEAELALYGLPPHLNDQSLVEWQTIVRSAKTRTCTLRSSYMDGRPVQNGQPAYHTMTPYTSRDINSWQEIDTHAPTAFTGWGIHETTYPETIVVAYWHFPTVQAQLLQPVETMSAWIGLGIDSPYANCQGNPNLLQDGTGSQALFGGNNSYYLWVQNLGSVVACGEQQLGGLVEFHNGDLMYSSVTAANGTVFLQDQTIGDYYSGPVPLSGSGAAPAYTGSSICTIEQNGGNSLHVLPDFESVDFQWCRTYATVSGVSHLYALPHVPGNTQVIRWNQINTTGSVTWPNNYCAYAEMPDNPTDPTYPDSTFFVDFYQNCVGQ